MARRRTKWPPQAGFPPGGTSAGTFWAPGTPLPGLKRHQMARSQGCHSREMADMDRYSWQKWLGNAATVALGNSCRICCPRQLWHALRQGLWSALDSTPVVSVGFSFTSIFTYFHVFLGICCWLLLYQSRWRVWPFSRANSCGPEPRQSKFRIAWGDLESNTWKTNINQSCRITGLELSFIHIDGVGLIWYELIG